MKIQNVEFVIYVNRKQAKQVYKHVPAVGKLSPNDSGKLRCSTIFDPILLKYALYSAAALSPAVQISEKTDPFMEVSTIFGGGAASGGSNF